MNILIIDIDSTIPNLALKKVEKYHCDKGDRVEFTPIFREWADKIYVSCIFPENKWKCDEWENDPKAIIGGTGYDIYSKLPEEIEKIKPKINWGFTTRGCIRNCYFCFVPKKEGGIKVVGDIYDIWDGTSKEITLMDNNILAIPDHFEKICEQIKKERLKVDFNQGLDHRLVTENIAKLILGLHHTKEIRFAIDDISSISTAKKCLGILKANGLKNWGTRWYCYIGENDTWETVYPRLKFLHESKQLVYVMRDRKIAETPLWVALSRWGNFMGAFKYELKDLITTNDDFKSYKKIILEYLDKGK